MADNIRGFVINSLTQFNTYLSESILPAYAGYSYVYDAYSYILNVIYDNEYVTAYGLIQLNERINNLDAPDLSVYALKSDLTSYAKKSDLTTYAKKSDLSTYVSKTELDGLGYVTYAYAFSEYPTYTYLENKLTNIDLSTYVSKTELDSLGYVTYAYVFNEYPTYTYLDNKLANIDLSTYVSKTELDSLGYVTYAYAFNEYPTYTYLDNKLANIDLSTYVSKTELNNAGYLTSIPNTYPTYSAISEMGYITSIPSEYITQTTLSNQSYAGYTYIYDSYAYIMGKISQLELAAGGGGSGTTAEGGITAISFNGVAASITGSVASITAPINDPAVTIQIDGETYSFTLNQSTAYTINLGSVLREHQSLATYVSKTELSAQGYLTSHQDLSTYVSKTELSAQSYLTSIPNTYATYAAISAMSYVTQTQLDNAGYITSGLPAVTSSDNGKILMVVNGSWTLVTPATLYSGNATPSNANGNNGDIYLQS